MTDLHIGSNDLKRWRDNLIVIQPEIQAAILNKTLPDTAPLFDLASCPPLSWEEQRKARRPISVCMA